jgi:SAM-dependent methyltransferase
MSASQGWEKWGEWNDRNMRPISDFMREATAAGPGKRVLDVACGVGIPSLALATAGAEVTAVDVSAEMIAALDRRARREGLSIATHEMNAENLRFEASPFDAVTCSFGLMFAPDPVKAVSEMRRVLKPGGRFAIAVWADPSKNPFFTTAFGALQQVAPPPPPAPNAPSMFGLGAPGALQKVLRSGGFSELTVEERALNYEIDSVDAHFEMFSDMAPPIQNAVRTLPAEDVTRLRNAMREAIAPFTHGGRVRLPATAVVAWGRAT